MWTKPTQNVRPLVFKCPSTGVNVISDIRIHDGDECGVAPERFAVLCPCCEQLHHFYGYESRNVQRRYAQLRASI